MTAQPPVMNELCAWFDEQDGFKQGTAAPHKWVLQANAEIHRLHAHVHEPKTERDAAKSALSGLSKRKDDWKWRAMEAEAQLVTEASRTAAEKRRADQMAEQHRMQAAMHAEARQALVEEVEAAENWRRLALQFDGHRMQALGYLKALLKGEKDLETGARSFIASPPIPGEQVLAERISALAEARLFDAGLLPMVLRLQLATERHLELCKRFGAEGFHFDPPPEDVLVILNHLQQKAPQCWCSTCRPITLSDMRFVVCPECGNKRCPRAHNHELACTGSNAPGQPGSSWEHVKPATGAMNGN